MRPGPGGHGRLAGPALRDPKPPCPSIVRLPLTEEQSRAFEGRDEMADSLAAGAQSSGQVRGPHSGHPVDPHERRNLSWREVDRGFHRREHPIAEDDGERAEELARSRLDGGPRPLQVDQPARTAHPGPGGAHQRGRPFKKATCLFLRDRQVHFLCSLTPSGPGPLGTPRRPEARRVVSQAGRRCPDPLRSANRTRPRRRQAPGALGIAQANGAKAVPHSRDPVSHQGRRRHWPGQEAAAQPAGGGPRKSSGSTGAPSWRTSKWRWGPLVLPDSPTVAMTCPSRTGWPVRTRRSRLCA